MPMRRKAAWVASKQGNYSRLAVALESLTEEGLGGGDVTRSTKVRRFASLINRAVEVHPLTPLTAYFEVGLVHTPGIADRPARWYCITCLPRARKRSKAIPSTRGKTWQIMIGPFVDLSIFLMLADKPFYFAAGEKPPSSLLFLDLVPNGPSQNSKHAPVRCR